MSPKNKICPTCKQLIERLRNVPTFKNKGYCSSDCAIAAWELTQERIAAREAEKNR